MSIGGRLEDLSVADMLQMLHLSRKSGVLNLESQGDAAAFYFRDGNITGARHPDPAKTVGSCLVEMGLCTGEQIAAGLKRQARAREDRLPLVAQLIVEGEVAPCDGARVLEHLIESAVRIVVAWGVGSFAFDPDAQPPVADDFAYATQGMVGSMECDTRLVLTDALRILEERNATAKGRLTGASDASRGPESAGRPAPVARETSNHADSVTRPGDANDVQVTRVGHRDPADVGRAETIPAPKSSGVVSTSQSESVFGKQPQSRRTRRDGGEQEATRPEIQLSMLHQYVLQMKEWQSATGASLTTLQFLSQIVDRCVIFLVRRRDVLGIGGFGLDAGGAGSSDVIAGFRLMVEPGSRLHEVITRGRVVLVQSRSKEIVALHERIGAPSSDSILLLPLMGDRRAIALVYCDFGAREPSRLPIEAIEILASGAGMAMQLAMARILSEDEPVEHELYRTMTRRKSVSGCDASPGISLDTTSRRTRGWDVGTGRA